MRRLPRSEQQCSHNLIVKNIGPGCVRTPTPRRKFLRLLFGKQSVNSAACFNPQPPNSQLFAMFSTNRLIQTALKFFTIFIFVFVALGAFAAPPTGVLDETHAAIRAVMAVQSEVTPDLLQQPEILGT